MTKTLVGIVTFGNLPFTKLAVESIRSTTEHPIDFFMVVGKPGDVETIDWIESQKDITYIVHQKNMGFPHSLNDIYDYAWKLNNYDYLIIAGNDVVAYPYCVDSLIDTADSSDYECISARQYDAKDLTRDFPESRQYFKGEFKLFYDFNSKPWEMFKDYSETINVEDMQLSDIQNLCLYKKSVFDEIGYTDVAYYPAYFVDNDYALRMSIVGLKYCTLTNARFFHFWSRTIHQGDAGLNGINHRYFRNNEAYYKQKWGGAVGKEIVTISTPLEITDRSEEEQTIDYWRNR